jgi:nucleotidyltransferase/DNA polymerase involved in DNA repair
LYFAYSQINHNFSFFIVLDNPFGDLKSLSADDNRLVQAGSLIAVSYEARACGVKRSMRGAEAKQVNYFRLFIASSFLTVYVHIMRCPWC